MSARDLQAQALEQLFDDPERNEKVAERPKIPHAREPWDRIRNTLGSNAGPGSGDFHVYRELRRLESDRVSEMVDDGKRAAEQEAYEKRVRLREIEDAEKTAKNRARRERKKQAQKRRKLEVAEQAAQTTQSEQSKPADAPQASAQPRETHVPAAREADD
ncbi:hypothetical protein MCUN1_003407 [Malassezia cuniculi]|uniref:PRKR-interacting protein 1 n=1 Tax=Malassezia cuniculi TaxID=948313 RepID=A0AAF0J884_9BASI|nr:hypothetical protein MCUN1_003407 [Malassezia cuniculi]